MIGGAKSLVLKSLGPVIARVHRVRTADVEGIGFCTETLGLAAVALEETSRL